MKIIRIRDRASEFAEDKDIAAGLRESEVRPALKKKGKVRIDFSEVDGATQSFIHALLSDVIRKEGPQVLDRIEFKNCSPAVRGVIEIVVEYSQLSEE